MNEEFIEDEWVEIPNEELAKKGKTQFVYKPSNYPGPIAMNATVKSFEASTTNPQRVENLKDKNCEPQCPCRILERTYHIPDYTTE